MLRLLFILSLVLSTGAPRLALAGDRLLADGQEFNVKIRDQEVAEVFQELSVAIGIPITISDSVRGSVTLSLDEASPKELLDEIARSHSLDWRYDGRKIDVTSWNEQVTRIFDLDGVKVATLETALKSLKVYDKRFPISAVDGSFGMIVAPPKYAALVEVVLGKMLERKQVQEAKLRAEALRRMQFEAESRAQRERIRRANRAVTPLVIRNGIIRGG